MKLRNKKTGEIGLFASGTDDCEVVFGVRRDDGKIELYNSLAELNAEWQDYEEPKSGIESIRLNDMISGRHIVEIDFTKVEEAEKAVEKLKAWKRLKDKGFQFHGHNALGVGEITFSLDFEDMDDEGEIGQLRHDLDLLFGGEE